MTHKILIVDDEEATRQEVVEYLSDKGYRCREASGMGPAEEMLIEDSKLAIVVTDINMPGGNGLDLITNIKSELNRNVEFIIMTGHGRSQDAIGALRLGAQDFIEKPVDLRHLLHVIQRTDQLLHLQRSESLYRESLSAKVEAKTAEVHSLLEELETAYEEALDLLAEAAEYKDPETGNHIKRIGAYARFMAAELGWSDKRQKIIELAAPLHDVGKIGIPDAVLAKPGKLTPDEVAIMKQHSEIGLGILSRSNHAVMRCAATIAWAHHER